MTEKRLFAEMTPRRARIGGVVLVLCALVLAAIGIFLAAFTLDLPYAAALLPEGVRIDASNRPAALADRLTDPAGLATLWVGAFALVTLLLGLHMLVFGRRIGWLFWPFLALVAVFVATGVWAVLESGGRMPRLHF
jgi:hypothetical protein